MRAYVAEKLCDELAVLFNAFLHSSTNKTAAYLSEVDPSYGLSFGHGPTPIAVPI